MMDNQTFALLSKFTVATRRVAISVNPSRLMTDKHYAHEVFKKVNDIGDEVLIMMSLDLQNRLGLLAPIKRESAPVVENKYIFGARG